MTDETTERRITVDDAFRLPPATASRFLLLILTALVSSAYAYYWILFPFADVPGGHLRCAAQAYAEVQTATPAELVRTFNSCHYGVNVRFVAYLVGSCLLLLVVTGLFYVTTPWLVLRRGALPLDRVGDLPGVTLVRELVAQAGRPVQVHVSVAPLVGLARTFGRYPRYHIVLDARLLRPTSQDQTALRAVLMHELGHVANRDVDLTSAAIAMWWAFLLVVATPFLVVGLLRPEGFLDLAWRLGILVVLMWLVRVTVLRIREHYADLHVARTSFGDDLAQVLATIPQRPTTRGLRGRLNWFLRSVHHPHIRHRLAVLQGSLRLHRLDPATGAATGLLLGFGYAPTIFVATVANPWSESFHVTGWVVGLLFGSLVAGVVTGTVWRTAQGSVALGVRPRGVWPFGIAFTLGVVAAQYVAPQFPWAGNWGTVMTQAPLIGVLSALVLLLLTQSYLRWVMRGALLRLRRGTNERRAYRLGVLQSSIVVALWLAFWFRLNEFLVVGKPELSVFSVILFSIALDPTLQLTILWACAYLVVTWYGARTPLVSTLVFSGVVTIGFALAVIPLYPALRRGLLAAYDSGQPEDLLGPLLLLVAVAAATALAVGFVHGLVSGGRERAGTAVASGLLALVIPVLCVERISNLHMIFSICGLSAEGLACVRRATFPSGPNGTNYLLLFAAMAAGAVLAILLGSLTRTLVEAVSQKPITSRPPRGRLAVLALFSPVVVAIGIFAWEGSSEWVHAQFTRDPIIGPAEVDALDRQPASPVAMTDACARLVGLGQDINLSQAVGSAYRLRIADAVAYARAAPDPVLRMMSTEASQALRIDRRRGNEAIAALRNYCLALPATAFLPGAYGASRDPTTSPTSPTVTEGDVAEAGCVGCRLTGQVSFQHPSWGPVTFAVALAQGERADLLVFDAEGEVVWHRSFEGAWEAMAPATPPVDTTGNLFVVYNPGRYDGVIILRPADGGFVDFGTLPNPELGRFYGATLDYDPASSQYTVRSEINDCTPTCAEGTTRVTTYHFDGSDYVEDTED